MVDWRPARSLTVLRDQVNAAHPGRSTAADGMIASAAHHEANPASDHEPRLIRGEWIVCAFDITAAPWTQALVDSLVASRDRRIKYVIWNRRFCAGVPGWGSAPWQWVGYTGSDPHTGHMHLSVNAATCDDTRPWSIGDDMPTADEIADAVWKKPIAYASGPVAVLQEIAQLRYRIAAEGTSPDELAAAIAGQASVLAPQIAAAIKADLGGSTDAAALEAAVETGVRKVLTEGIG